MGPGSQQAASRTSRADWSIVGPQFGPRPGRGKASEASGAVPPRGTTQWQRARPPPRWIENALGSKRKSASLPAGPWWSACAVPCGIWTPTAACRILNARGRDRAAVAGGLAVTASAPPYPCSPHSARLRQAGHAAPGLLQEPRGALRVGRAGWPVGIRPRSGRGGGGAVTAPTDGSSRATGLAGGLVISEQTGPT